MSKISTKKTQSPPSTTPPKSAKSKAKGKKPAPQPAPAPEPEASKMGRPAGEVPRVTISFRVPEAVQDAFVKLADVETKAKPGRVIKPSELYNEALASFLTSRGVTIEGWNG